MVLDFRLDDGAQALDQQQQLDFQRGYQVIGAASGSNLVTAAGLAVDVAGGDINAGGTTVSCAAASDVPLTAADPDQPRVDVVYRDTNGTVQIKDGTPATVEPAGGRDRDAYQPSPYDMHDIDGVVLATVWVSAGATSIGSGDIRDRRLPASLDVDTLNATSVSTEGVNNVLWASSPDEITEKLNALPNYGGVVNLVPGDYGDSDFSQRIEIPTTSGSHYMVNMAGSRIALTDFSPTEAYIRRQSDTNARVGRLTLHGPSLFDVSGVSSPPSAASLWDLANSDIYFPSLKGRFQWVVESHAAETSGHINRFYASGFKLQGGYLIKGDSATNDRSYYYGNFDSIETVGCKVDNGQQNHLHVHVQDEKSGYNATGYELINDAVNNTIHVAHAAVTTPLNIQSRNNEFNYNSNASGDFFATSKAAIAPRNVDISRGTSTEYNFGQEGATSLLDTSGDGSTSFRDFGRLRLASGGSSGNVQPLQTRSSIGTLSDGQLHYSVVRPINDTDVVYREGLYVDSNNRVQFEYDASANTNWRAVVVSGGTEVANIDTGVSLTTGNVYTFHINLGPSSQEFLINHSSVASETADISGFGRPFRHRTSVETQTNSAKYLDVDKRGQFAV